jgi:5-bromo-4-chloroindolyl phosphate hydrolysis protein
MPLFDNIKDFYNFNKEFNLPQSKKYREIVDSIYDYIKENPKSFSKISEGRSKLISLANDIKIECDKDYSEKKYELLDQYENIHTKFNTLRNRLIEECVTLYYSKYRRNLFEDLKEVIEWLPSSKYISDIDRELITNLNRALSDSEIKDDFDDFENW